MSGGTPSASGASPVLTQKGDIIGFDTARKRIGVGSDNQVLTADSTNANGIAWKDTSGGSETHEFTSTSTFTPTKQTGITKITTDTTGVTSIADYSPSSIQINVDGSSIGAITDTVFTRVVNPSSSLTIESLNPSSPIINYDSVTGSISGGQGIDFKPDGTKVYGVNNAWRGVVYEYNLSTAWDLSTLSFVSSYNPPSPNGNGYGMDIRLHPNGTRWYELSRWYNKIYQYDMSTAWSVSTASYGGQGSTSNTNQTGSGLFIKDDGVNVYVCEYSTGTVQQHSMSTAWDITTLAYDSKSFSVASQEANPQSISFKPDGTKMYISGANKKIYRYSLSTAWDLSTASYDSVAFDVTSGGSTVNGLYLKTDFTKWFVYGGSTAYQHSIDTTFAGSALVTVV